MNRKINILLFFFIIFFSQSCIQKTEQCGDFLKRYEIDKVIFKGCKKDKYHQLDAFKADYIVTGIDALDVENRLIKKINMSPLKYSCCGWENGYAEVDDNNNHLIVIMFSEETLIQSRKSWNNIKHFHINVFSLLEEP